MKTFSGTFIAVDQLLQLVDDPSEMEVDIFRHVYNLRRERRYMVQSSAQYTYVYKCVHEHLRRKTAAAAASVI